LDKQLRSVLSIPCEGAALVATLDGPGDATVGWLFVIGGTQTRVGPHRLYERLAARLAEAGQAVIRFDRRGVGDSGGEDPGYLESGADLAAAAHALRQNFPKLGEIFGFGLCDGATALTLHGDRCKLAGAVLANPWVVEPQGELPPAAAIRGHYKQRLLDPKAWMRLLSGGVNLRKLARGIAHSRAAEDDTLARRFASGLPAHAAIVLAEGDGTAQAFAAAWKEAGKTSPAAIRTVATASHSFADPAGFEALAQALLGAVTRRR
jgi:exosortase A-associated hydrolase 1